MATKTALVTGATKGLGRALVRELCSGGVRVVASGRTAELLATLAEETGCLTEAADLADPAAVTLLYQRASEALGEPPSIVVNNAGYNSRKAPLVETSLEEFEHQYAVNLRAPYLLSREALRDMVRRGQGHIVNIASSTVLHGIETMGVYTTMKHGLRGLHTVLVKEARAAGVKVTIVFPGGMDTDFREQGRPEYTSASTGARLVAQCIFAPDDAVVHELVFRPLVETNF